MKMKNKIKRRNAKIFSCLLILAIISSLLLSCGSVANDSKSYIDTAEGNAKFDDYFFSSNESFGSLPDEDGDYSYVTGETENATAPLEGRKVIKNVDLTAETKEYDKAKASLESLVSSLGGYIQSSNESGKSYYSNKYVSRTANYVLRVPAENLDSFIDSVGGLVNITNSSTSVNDITDTYVDIEARINTLKVEEDRLLALLEKGDKLSDIIQIEERLSDVRYQIESYTAKIKSYDTLIAYSTITVNLNEVVEYSPDPVKKVTFGERISNAFKSSWADFADGCRNLAVEFVYLIPTLLVWVVIIAAIVLLIKQLRKRSRRKKAERARLAEEYQNAQRVAQQKKNTESSDKN